MEKDGSGILMKAEVVEARPKRDGTRPLTYAGAPAFDVHVIYTYIHQRIGIRKSRRHEYRFFA